MHPRFKIIVLIMFLAFIAFAGIIEYAKRHPVDENDYRTPQALIPHQ